MKKEEDVETSGGGRKGQKKKEIALPGFHIESLRSSGTFTPHPLPPLLVTGFLPPVHPIQPSRRPRRLLTLNFLSCITALRLSSRVKKKKKYKWKKPAAERTTLPARKRGASSNLSISLVGLFPPPSRPLSPPPLSCFFPFFFHIYIYSERGSMTGARSIPRRFTAKRGSETRNTDGNLHS